METVAAEVEYRPGKQTEAARALQRLGFQVLDVGATISVQAPGSLWTSVFDVSFERRTRTVTQGVEETYLQPATEDVRVPADLQHVIAELLFVPPPEFFTS